MYTVGSSNTKRGVNMVKEGEKYTLKQIRRFRGITQEQLAERIGVTTDTIGNYENKEGRIAKASYETLQKIAEVLEVRIEDILF